MDVGRYVKGGIWWYQFPKSNRRGILGGTHPCMIVSHVSNPQSGCTVIVAPISHLSSSKDNPDCFFAVPIQLPNNTENDKSFVCCNQLTPVVTNDLYTYEGQATGKMIATVDSMIMKYLMLSSTNSTYKTSLTFEETCTEELDLSGLISNPNMNFKDCRKEEQITKHTERAKTCRPKKGKKIYCVETGEEFASSAEAARKFNVCSQTILNSIKFGRPTSDGYQFRRES